MIKREIYPKTPRLSLQNVVYITEKLDGENLTIFKKDNKLYIATRGCIVNIIDDFEEDKGYLYKGMYTWLLEHRDWLLENICDNSAICGEWLGAGYLHYGQEMTEKRFFMFAKANIDEEWHLYNLKYNHDLFRYPFTNINQEQVIPDFIKIVPIVSVEENIPTISRLDELYEWYKKVVNRDVEGFVINFQDKICKYVRKKNGKETPHMEKGE